MSGEQIPFTFKLRSGVFSEQQIKTEINGLRSTDAYRNVMKDISGKIPGAVLAGKSATIKNFVITDDPNIVGVSSKNADVPGLSSPFPNGDFVIYLNPDYVKFDPATGRTLTVAEILVHELGHATDAGFAALQQDWLSFGLSSASERVAHGYESDLAAEKGLAPIPNARSANSVRQRQSGESPNYLTKTDPGCFLAGTKISINGKYGRAIEDLAVGDDVLAFDVRDASKSLTGRRVAKKFKNITKLIINLRGLCCTPGHVFCTRGKNSDSYIWFATIGSILREDSTLVEQDGAVIRARMGAKLGSGEDALVAIVYYDHATVGMPGVERRALVRAGIPMARRRYSPARSRGISRPTASPSYRTAACARLMARTTPPATGRRARRPSTRTMPATGSSRPTGSPTRRRGSATSSRRTSIRACASSAPCRWPAAPRRRHARSDRPPAWSACRAARVSPRLAGSRMP